MEGLEGREVREREKMEKMHVGAHLTPKNFGGHVTLATPVFHKF